MSLKILTLEEDQTEDISFVPRTDIEEPVIVPELPNQYLESDDAELLEQSAAALESIGLRIACEGMSLSTARDLDKIKPGFMRQAGGYNTFTGTPSLEGLTEGVKAVKDGVMSTLKRLREFVAKMLQSFKEWLVAKFGQTERQDVKPAVVQFVAERRNHDAIRYLSELPETAEGAADEIARFMDGETNAFASSLTDQFNSLMKNVGAIEEMLKAEPTHHRIARGVVSIEELFKSDGDFAIKELLRKAYGAADVAMKARTAEKLTEAVSIVDSIAKELAEFSSNTFISDKPNEEFDNGGDVSLVKIYDNIQKAINDMQRVDVKKLVAMLAGTLDPIISISANTKLDEVLEMIPEDVAADQREAIAQKIIALYRQIAELGKKALKLWKVRADAVGSLNKVGDALIGLVSGFEKAVIDSAGSLTPEQKTQLAKAMSARGLKVEF